jgi:hypothetical protein
VGQRRDKGSGSLTYDSNAERWVARLDLGITPAGKRVRVKATAATRAEAAGPGGGTGPQSEQQACGRLRAWSTVRASRGLVGAAGSAFPRVKWTGRGPQNWLSSRSGVLKSRDALASLRPLHWRSAANPVLGACPVTFVLVRGLRGGLRADIA